ncbi:MAG: hypothetical protein LC808_43870, partial [Actinobacteria bacterium]|nr:hypothetical protein [Actinomycetota bacterium]
MSRDLMHSDELKTLVRDAYCSIEEDTTAIARRLYEERELDGVPAGAMSRALGVNNHLRFAEIQEGETILD